MIKLFSRESLAHAQMTKPMLKTNSTRMMEPNRRIAASRPRPLPPRAANHVWA